MYWTSKSSLESKLRGHGKVKQSKANQIKSDQGEEARDKYKPSSNKVFGSGQRRLVEIVSMTETAIGQRRTHAPVQVLFLPLYVYT